MTNSEYYKAYAALEAASEQFHEAAKKMAELVPDMKDTLTSARADVRFALVMVDRRLDELI